MVQSIKNTLEELARETDPEARSRLIRTVTAEYARRTGNAPSEIERTLFSALVLDVYEQIDPTVRRDLITLLARTNHITTDLAERLSNERDDWVTTLYEHSPMLSDQLLLNAVRERNEEVLLSIAKRKRVPETLVDALMARAYASVIGQLLRNTGAEFSRHSIMLCTIICQNSQPILSMLAARCLIDDIFMIRVTKEVEDGCPFLPISFSQALKDEKLAELAGKWRETPDKLEIDGETFSREEAVVQINLGERSFDSLLATLVDRQNKDDIVWLLKDAQDLTKKAVEHLLVSEGNQTLKRLLLEQNVSVRTFEALTQWRADALGFPQRHMYRDVEDYRQSLRRRAG